MRDELVRKNPGKEPDMRAGWLLYQPATLREFLYFEQPKVAPDPDDYYAIWKRHPPKGARKASVNLWVYEKETKKKRYSVTTAAGAKIQPYFDVPAPDDPNLYHFVVQSEEVEEGIRIWLTPATARELKLLLGVEQLTIDRVSAAILEAEAHEATGEEVQVIPVIIKGRAYAHLLEHFEGVSDEHRVRLFLEFLRAGG